MTTHLFNDRWVNETRFGKWFLGTDTWFKYVVSEAFTEFYVLLRNDFAENPCILDAGCGYGLSFPLLHEYFRPKSIIGIDIDPEIVQFAAANVSSSLSCRVEIHNQDINEVSLAAESIDIVVCHQLLHHMHHQMEALQTFYRLLKPGGVVLICESCKRFINSFPVRLLFRHPIGVQKTSSEYIELVRSQGFMVDEDQVKRTTPWWSKSDLGVLAKFGWRVNTAREYTEIFIVARKPRANAV